MSPIRKVDDLRAVEIESWDEFVHEELAESMARGDFDDLPHAGKPIKIWQTDVNPEYDLAFSRLKNAGVMPVWMELDKDVGQREAELRRRLDTTEAVIREMLMQLRKPVEAMPKPQGNLWQRFLGWFRQGFPEDDPAPPSITSIMATRERERRKFLEMAAELDKKIVTYHDSLPKGGEHLQRLRWLPDRAARVFDDRIALTSWWDEVDR